MKIRRVAIDLKEFLKNSERLWRLSTDFDKTELTSTFLKRSLMERNQIQKILLFSFEMKMSTKTSGIGSVGVSRKGSIQWNLPVRIWEA